MNYHNNYGSVENTSCIDRDVVGYSTISFLVKALLHLKWL